MAIVPSVRSVGFLTKIFRVAATMLQTLLMMMVMNIKLLRVRYQGALLNGIVQLLKKMAAISTVSQLLSFEAR